MSEFEQGQIQALLNENKSIAAIALKLKRSYNTVKNYKKRNGPYKLAVGPKKKLEIRAKRRIVRELLANETISLKKLVNSLNMDVHISTVSRFLHLEGYKYAKYLKAPQLSTLHKKKRKDWATDNLVKMALDTINVKNITFSDEKRFCLDGPDGYRYYWQKSGSIQKFFGKKLFTKSVIVSATMAPLNFT